MYEHTTKEFPDMNDIELLKIGRHFRLSDNTKLIVGRNKMENEILDSLKLDDDVIIEVSNHAGPIFILRINKQLLTSSSSSSTEKEIEIAASTALRYSDSPKDKFSTVKIKKGVQIEKEIQVFPIDNKVLDELRI